MDKRLVSIRGAVTAENTEISIRKNTKSLIDRLYFKNGLVDGDVVNITFSLTHDLNEIYPARVVREMGHNVPLFTCEEPRIKGALEKCIRVMITAYSENPPRSIYLGGARTLRPDVAEVYAIALDGPSGAGKSTVAKIVSEELGIMYLDTGALYRALGLTALRAGADVNNAVAVENALKNVNIGVEYDAGMQRVFVDGEDVSGLIRTPEVSMAASAVSAVPYVRRKLLGIQRDIAKKSKVILDGRDIGTVVLPDAEFKFFLTASAEVRARRRYDELVARGASVTYEKILDDIITRDRNDSTREVAPLKRAFDAVEIVSDDISARDVAKIIIDTVTEDVK